MKKYGNYPDPLAQAYDAYLHNQVVIKMNHEKNISYILREYKVNKQEFLNYINELKDGIQTGA